MAEFLERFIGEGYFNELWSVTFDHWISDNPLNFLFFLFMCGFVLFLIRRILFGG